MRVVTVTDAWHPQVNGVVRTIEATQRELQQAGHEVMMITPREFVTVAAPRYSEIRLSLFAYRRTARLLDAALQDGGCGTQGPAQQARCTGTASNAFRMSLAAPKRTASAFAMAVIAIAHQAVAQIGDLPSSGPMAGLAKYEFNNWLFRPCPPDGAASPAGGAALRSGVVAVRNRLYTGCGFVR